jgi:hypothetical protein
MMIDTMRNVTLTGLTQNLEKEAWRAPLATPYSTLLACLSLATWTQQM